MRNIADGRIGKEQLLPGDGKPVFVKILHERHAGLLMKEMTQIIFAQMGFPRDVFHADDLTVMRSQIREHRCEFVLRMRLNGLRILAAYRKKLKHQRMDAQIMLRAFRLFKAARQIGKYLVHALRLVIFQTKTRAAMRGKESIQRFLRVDRFKQSAQISPVDNPLSNRRRR